MNNTRLVLGDSSETSRISLREMLRRAGYLVVAEVESAQKALHQVSKIEPDVAVLDVELDGFDSLQVTRVMEERRIAPLVLTVSYDNEVIHKMASAGGVFGVLVKPVQETALFPAIESAIFNFKQVKKLEKENRRLSKELENRKIIERAKVLLMEKRGMSEEDAYRYIQRLSMDRCVSMKKIAGQIISLIN